MPSIGIEIDKERNPPPPATPLDFPNYIPTGSTETSSSSPRSSTKLYRLLGTARRAQDIPPTCLDELNLSVTPNVPISHIVPGNGEKPHPQPRLEKTPDQEIPGIESMTVQSLMNNGKPFPPQEKYDLLKNEILVDNEDAFREVTRLPALPGRTRVRIAHTRKFWVGLERMSQYWDDSHDQYIEPAGKGTKLGDTESNNDGMPVDGQIAPQDSMKDSTSAESMDVDQKEENADTSKDQSAGEDKAPAEPTTMYKGRRISTGSQMSDELREEAIRGFLEMIGWPFGCQAHIPSLPPRLSIQNLLFPVRVSFAVSRSPQDRQEARKGILEGPLMVGQCRNETAFREDGQDVGQGHMEMCDLLREVGSMLLGAQERAREGSTEIKPGDGKWWTTKPRWGGLDQGVTGEKASRVEDEPSEEPNKRSRHDRTSHSSRRSGGSRRMSTNDKWKLVQPGPSLWDKKMKYTQIGKDKNSEFDDVSNPLSFSSYDVDAC